MKKGDKVRVLPQSKMSGVLSHVIGCVGEIVDFKQWNGHKMARVRVKGKNDSSRDWIVLEEHLEKIEG